MTRIVLEGSDFFAIGSDDRGFILQRAPRAKRDAALPERCVPGEQPPASVKASDGYEALTCLNWNRHAQRSNGGALLAARHYSSGHESYVIARTGLRCKNLF